MKLSRYWGCLLLDLPYIFSDFGLIGSINTNRCSRWRSGGMGKYILPKSSVVCGIGKNCLESFEVHMFPYEPIYFFRNGFVQKSWSPISRTEIQIWLWTVLKHDLDSRRNLRSQTPSNCFEDDTNENTINTLEIRSPEVFNTAWCPEWCCTL